MLNKWVISLHFLLTFSLFCRNIYHMTPGIKTGILCIPVVRFKEDVGNRWKQKTTFLNRQYN